MTSVGSPPKMEVWNSAAMRIGRKAWTGRSNPASRSSPKLKIPVRNGNALDTIQSKTRGTRIYKSTNIQVHDTSPRIYKSFQESIQTMPGTRYTRSSGSPRRQSIVSDSTRRTKAIASYSAKGQLIRGITWNRI